MGSMGSGYLRKPAPTEALEGYLSNDRGLKPQKNRRGQSFHLLLTSIIYAGRAAIETLLHTRGGASSAIAINDTNC